MHMHLDLRRHIAHDQHAVPNTVQAPAEGIHFTLSAVLPQILDRKLRAVGKVDRLNGAMIIFKARFPIFMGYSNSAFVNVLAP